MSLPGTIMRLHPRSIPPEAVNEAPTFRLIVTLSSIAAACSFESI